MLNIGLIKNATQLALEAKDKENEEVIYNRCIDWYNHSEIVDAEMLAAVALTGPYDPDYTWDDIVAAHEYYFPKPIENELNYCHIHEIEEALHDLFWEGN